MLREIWDEYDVCMYLADHYKLISNVSFVTIFLLAVATVACTNAPAAWP